MAAAPNAAVEHSEEPGSTAGDPRKGGSATGNSTAGREEAVPALDCPNCGREVDAELDFCHWCTEELPWATDTDE